MAAFIDNLTETEQVLELASYVNKLKTKGEEGNQAFYEECVKLNEANQHLELLKKLIDELPLVFTDGTDKEAEGLIFVVFALAKKLDADQKAVEQLISQITQVLSKKDEKPLLSIRIFNNLYNILGNTSTERYRVYLGLLRFAATTHSGQHLLDQIQQSDIDAKISEWNLSTSQKREVLKQIRDIFSTGKSTKSFGWNVKYLSSFDLSNTTETDLNEAEAVALEAIRAPDQYQFDDLLSLPIVKKLEGNPRHGKVYQLLKIFVHDTQEAYKAFIEQNSDFLVTHGLNADETSKKIKLLSLATLASSNQEVPYSLIAKTLHVSEDDVEHWIITAISDGVITGKMDQQRRVVIVSRTIQRVFTRAQWQQVAESLNMWRANIKVILNHLRETKKLTPAQQAAIARAQS
eukprot:TRINITY_DN758_c0_g1_i1.p1 TRINITY_DN758_c0_g1~~TRINITY_DN758_c0_g1_i1.p1  ORF type:complete len:405 (-),score=137.11 TRINITY_DN758_c0_g1_i1:72-1286(-)